MSRKRIATAADLAALNRNAGAVVTTYPPNGGRVRVAAPDHPKPRRRKGGK